MSKIIFKHLLGTRETNMKQSGSYITFFALIALASCGDNHPKPPKYPDFKSAKFQNKLVDANKMYVKRESDEIDQYVAHNGWQMITTGTGLRYMIIKKGTGALARPDSNSTMTVKVKFKKSLLDGTLCYSSDSTGAEEFTIGQDNVESGLHEGIQYMHVGDKAVMILPSHLAFGLVGDGKKIPAKASVLYELELLSLRVTKSQKEKEGKEIEN
ncbi:MAG: FKBP-type peptidyl-prolyl cis-trans isomerase [Bacteroidia bacterium]